MREELGFTVCYDRPGCPSREWVAVNECDCRDEILDDYIDELDGWIVEHTKNGARHYCDRACADYAGVDRGQDEPPLHRGDDR